MQNMTKGQKFQFHKGAIRTNCHDADFVDQINFNSIKVRLEHQKTNQQSHHQFYFNSIKVRLEPNQINLFNPTTKFQFHKGAIRTAEPKSIQEIHNQISIP